MSDEDAAADGHDEEEGQVKAAAWDTPAAFFEHFRLVQEEIQSCLKSAEAGTGVNEAMDVLVGKVQRLEEVFNEAHQILAPYDIQKYQASLKQLLAEIATRREELAPRSKFSFTRKKPAKKAESKAATGGYNSAPAEELQVATEKRPGEIVKGFRNAVVARRRGEVAGKDVTLEDLEGCEVFLLDRLGAVHCHNLRKCVLWVGPVSSSMLLYDCHECVISVGMKQMRIHDGSDLCFYLHTMSNPVVERCKRVLFAPYDLWYEGFEEDWAQAAIGSQPGTEGASEMWCKVQDFNWHKRQASPHWKVFPEGERREARKPEPSGSPSLTELEHCRSAWAAMDSEKVSQDEVQAADSKAQSVDVDDDEV